MESLNLLNQLNIICKHLIKDDECEARRVFVSLNLTDTRLHESLPINIRILIWNLHEYLVVGDHENATDKEEILKRIDLINHSV